MGASSRFSSADYDYPGSIGGNPASAAAGGIGIAAARLVIDATLTRAEVYKLIGQLERLGGSL